MGRPPRKLIFLSDDYRGHVSPAERRPAEAATITDPVELMRAIRREQYDIIEYRGECASFGPLALLAELAGGGGKTAVIFDDLYSTGPGGRELRINTETNRPMKLTLRRPHPEISEIESRPGEGLSEREKLNLIMDTAATLSHEINNPLMAITAGVELLMKEVGQLSPQGQERLATIGKAAGRIKAVTRKLGQLDSLRYRETAGGRMISLDGLNIAGTSRSKVLSPVSGE